MARKEQITITLDRDLTAKLREIAKKRGASLSSVIEMYLKSVDSLSGKTDIQRVMELLSDIRHEILIAREDETDEAPEKTAKD